MDENAALREEHQKLVLEREPNRVGGGQRRSVEDGEEADERAAGHGRDIGRRWQSVAMIFRYQ